MPYVYLNAEDLSKVVSIIQRFEPSTKGEDSEELEVDFATLKPETCRALRQYLERVKSRSKKTQKRPAISAPLKGFILLVSFLFIHLI